MPAATRLPAHSQAPAALLDSHSSDPNPRKKRVDLRNPDLYWRERSLCKRLADVSGDHIKSAERYAVLRDALSFLAKIIIKRSPADLYYDPKQQFVKGLLAQLDRYFEHKKADAFEHDHKLRPDIAVCMYIVYNHNSYCTHLVVFALYQASLTLHSRDNKGQLHDDEHHNRIEDCVKIAKLYSPEINRMRDDYQKTKTWRNAEWFFQDILCEVLMVPNRQHIGQTFFESQSGTAVVTIDDYITIVKSIELIFKFHSPHGGDLAEFGKQLLDLFDARLESEHIKRYVTALKQSADRAMATSGASSSTLSETADRIHTLSNAQKLGEFSGYLSEICDIARTRQSNLSGFVDATRRTTKRDRHVEALKDVLETINFVQIKQTLSTLDQRSGSQASHDGHHDVAHQAAEFF